MKNGFLLRIFLLLVIFFILSAASYSFDRDTLFQISTLSALQEGVYDGVITLDELTNYGDFGIGTFEGLDGEMLYLDGRFYQVKSDGHVYQPAGSIKSPFAAVTFFDIDKKAPIAQEMDLKKLQEFIESLLPTKNIMYAVKVEGNFKYIKVRSVPRQNKPYPRLAEVVKNQPVFELNNMKGTIIGYWLPDYLKGINMTGFHLHFLSADHKAGGHLLDCVLTGGNVLLDYTSKSYLVLPEESDFYKTDLAKDKQKELEKIEK